MTDPPIHPHHLQKQQEEAKRQARQGGKKKRRLIIKGDSSGASASDEEEDGPTLSARQQELCRRCVVLMCVCTHVCASIHLPSVPPLPIYPHPQHTTPKNKRTQVVRPPAGHERLAHPRPHRRDAAQLPAGVRGGGPSVGGIEGCGDRAVRVCVCGWLGGWVDGWISISTHPTYNYNAPTHTNKYPPPPTPVNTQLHVQIPTYTHI